MQIPMRFWALGILCLLASGPCYLWGQGDSTAWEQYTRAAMNAVQRGNLAEAEKQYLAALMEAESLDRKTLALLRASVG